MRIAILWMSVILAVAASPRLQAQARMPDHALTQLRPFVGRWNVEQVLNRPGGHADTTTLESVIAFSADSSTLIVRESTADGRFHFVGYHTFDAHSQGFRNWGADSYQTIGWAEGRAEGTNLRFEGVVRFLSSGDTLRYRGFWRILDRDRHVYEAVGVDASNAGQVLKRDVYTRRGATRE